MIVCGELVINLAEGAVKKITKERGKIDSLPKYVMPYHIEDIIECHTRRNCCILKQQ
jgi:hypothetical protein